MRPGKAICMAQVQDDLGWLRSAPMRGVRIFGGACALIYDAVANTVRDPSQAVEQVELRGVRVQRRLRNRWSTLGSGSSAEIVRLTDSATAPVRWVQREVYATGTYSAEEMERQMERMLDKLGLPSRDKIEKLTREIEALSAQIDRELSLIARHEQAEKK